MSYIGSTKIGKIYLGNTEIAKAYLGNDLVFQNGGGPTPSIQPVFYDYLVFDGTAYIETNYVLPTNCSIGGNFGHETQIGAQRVFRSQGGGGYILLAYGNYTTSTSRQLVLFYDSASYLVNDLYVSFTYDYYSFFMTPTRYGVGENASTYTKGNSHPTGGIVFGDGVGGQAFTGRMGIFKVYDSTAAGATSAIDLENNYTPVATFRPCTYNGEAGMWYVEGNQFFGNTAGAGNLTVANNE